MEKHSLTERLSTPRSSIGNLFIVQDEYDLMDGKLSIAGMHNILIALLDEEEIPEPECTDDCNTGISVYRDDLTLAYNLYATFGLLTGPIVQEFSYVEKVQFSMQDSVQLEYPCFGMVDYRWLGEYVWLSDGEAVPSITPTVDISSVSTPQKVYGTLLIEYRVKRDRYNLLFYQRDGDIKGRYDSVVYAIHKGGPTWMEPSLPPGLESSGEYCSGGGGVVDINPPDEPDDPPTDGHEDARKIWDYCSQEITRDDTV